VDGAHDYVSTAGRVDNPSLLRPVAASVTVGYYAPDNVAAATIFAEPGCRGGSLRLYSSPDPKKRSVEYAENRVGIPKYFNKRMMVQKGHWETKTTYAQSALVPHGYSLQAFNADSF